MSGERLAASTAIATAGTGHIRLLYNYVDTGDLDAFASLLHEAADIEIPGLIHAHGRQKVLQLAAEHDRSNIRHHIDHILADGCCFVAIGTLEQDGFASVEFVDTFALSGDAMVLRQRRYHVSDQTTQFRTK